MDSTYDTSQIPELLTKYISLGVSTRFWGDNFHFQEIKCRPYENCRTRSTKDKSGSFIKNVLFQVQSQKNYKCNKGNVLQGVEEKLDIV